VTFPKEICTDRMVAGAVDPDRAHIVNAAIVESVDALGCWLAWADHIPSIEETRDFLGRARAKWDAADYGFTLWHVDDGLCVGGMGLHPRSSQPAHYEIGYWIRTSATGRGYATEALRALAATAFEHLDIAELVVLTSARNVASQRVALKAGFTLASVVVDGRIDPDGDPSVTQQFVRPRADVPLVGTQEK
jgi:RimJ/RimL family protein N-acetyltransferase